MKRETPPRVTVADVLSCYDISESTLTRRRNGGDLPSSKRDGPGRRWTFATDEVDALAADESWPVKAPISDQSDDGSRDRSLDSQTAVELTELRGTVTAQSDTIKRLTAERDRARSDAEHERTRADAAERESIRHQTQATERADQIDDLGDRLTQATELAGQRDDLGDRLAALEATKDDASVIAVPRTRLRDRIRRRR